MHRSTVALATVTMMSLCSLFAGLGLAQEYALVQSTGTSEPYDYTTTGTDILTPESDNVYSAAQAIPFPFSFYGVPVTAYYASDNGYITFAASPGSSVPNNTAIPSVAGPNNAIYAFWDDLKVVVGSGSADRVSKWTYGEAPYRVHVIQWYSVTPQSGAGFVYATIRLYECGDFDVVLNYGNAVGLTGTVGCENSSGTSATSVAGSPSLSYPSVGSAGEDDVVYSFNWSGVFYDLSVTSVDMGATVDIGPQVVSGTLVNNGSVAINSFTLNYTVNGGAVQSSSVNSAGMAPYGGEYAFVHPTTWTSAGGNFYDVEVWASDLNGTFFDQRPCNDRWTGSTIAILGNYAPKNVLLEVFTGAWCGWCPDGRVVRDQILTDFGGSVVAVDVHDGDAMAFSDGIATLFNVNAYPNGMVDRHVFAGQPDEPFSRGGWYAAVEERLTSRSPATISVRSTYNSATHEVAVAAVVHFVDYSHANHRIFAMLVEDNVVGTGTGYNQVNYLNTQAGHPYFGAGDPIIGYDHQHVLRANSSAVGVAGTIPTMVYPDDEFEEDFVFVLDGGVDPSQVSVVAVFAEYGDNIGDKEVLNVAFARLGQSSDGLIFTDGFESGGTGEWASASP